MAINELSETRYYGKTCEHHPEFKGLRLKSSYECVECRSRKKKGVSRGTPSVEQALNMKIDGIRHKIDELGRRKQELLNELKTACEALETLDESSVPRETENMGGGEGTSTAAPTTPDGE